MNRFHIPIIAAFISLLGCENSNSRYNNYNPSNDKMSDPYTLKTCVSGSTLLVIGLRTENSYKEWGKGIGEGCVMRLSNEEHETLINLYLFKALDKVKIRASLCLGGSDCTYYRAKNIEDIIDFSNFCSIVGAFSRILPLDEKDLFYESLRNLLKNEQLKQVSSSTSYLEYLCPYGSIVKVKDDEVTFIYQGKRSAYSVKMDLISAGEISKSSNLRYEFTKHGKHFSPTTSKLILIRK